MFTEWTAGMTHCSSLASEDLVCDSSLIKSEDLEGSSEEGDSSLLSEDCEAGRLGLYLPTWRRTPPGEFPSAMPLPFGGETGDFAAEAGC